MMRLFTLPPILLLACPVSAFVKPGEMTPSNLPRLRSEATVVATAIADDDSIFLLGDFNEVDGISRPGLAKLTSTGHLDTSFDPQIGVEMQLQVRSGTSLTPTLTSPLPGGATVDLGNIINFAPNPRPLFFPDNDLFALNNGRLFVRKEGAWTVLSADGSVDEQAFPGFDRNELSALPQLLQDERLIILTADSRLAALDLSDSDALDESFELDLSWTGDIVQAVSAGNGKLWVLSQRDRFMVVCRLNSDGSMDSSFPPLELRDAFSFRIEPGYNNGFILTNRADGVVFFSLNDPFIAIPISPCCGVSLWRNEQRIQWFNSIGVRTGVAQVEIGISGRTLLQSHPWHRVFFFNNTTQNWRSQYATGGPSDLPEFPYATPNQSSDLPLIFETIDSVPGSPSIFSQSHLIGGTRLYNSNGSLDPNHHIARLTRQAINIRSRSLPDGSLLVTGDFNQADQWSCRGMIKIKPDGEIDPSFAPDLDLRFTKKFKVRPDGKIFVILNQSWSNADGDNYSLLALSAEGKVDHEFPRISHLTGSAQIEVLADGSLLVEQGSPLQGDPWNPFLVAFIGNTLQRILPSGEIDEDWPLSEAQNPINFRSQKILALNDGSFIWGNSHYDTDGILIQTITGEQNLNPLYQLPDGSVIFLSHNYNLYLGNQLHRWTSGAELDPTFISGLIPHGNSILGIQAGTRGKLLVWGQLNTPSGARSMVRIHGTGQLDYTFDPAPFHHNLHPTSTPAILTNTGLQQFNHSRFSLRSIPSVIYPQDDSFLAGGSFGDSEGNFVHLADSHLSGYADWITSATGEHQPTSDDFDQDGRTNLHEYALGTNPIRPDSFTHEIQRNSLSPLRFQLNCNPEAPEVQRTIEVSTDLINWEFGTSHHFTTEPGSGCLNLRMTQSDHRLFLRTRYSLP